MKKLFFLLIGLALGMGAFSQTTLPKPLNPKVSDWIDQVPYIWPNSTYSVECQVMLQCGMDWMQNPVADDYPGDKAVFEAMGQGITLEYTTLDQDKVSYSIFTDNDKLFVFTPAMYADLFENVYPGMQEATRIPFGYEDSQFEFWFVHFPQMTNNVDVLIENGIDCEPFFTWRIGVQSYYTVDGQTSSSDIVYMEIFPQLKDAADVTSTSFLADWSCDAENTFMVDGFKAYHLYIINTATQDTIRINDIAPTNTYLDEWGNETPLPGATCLVEGLTPGTTYQYYVVSEGYYHTYKSAVHEVTLPVEDVYLLGKFDNQNWAPNAGTMMEYDAENQVYSATITINADDTFGFSTRLANNDDQAAWDYIEPYRFGPVSDGDFWLLEEYLMTRLPLTYDNYGAIRVLATGDYKVTVSLEQNYIVVEKVAPDTPGFLIGDVNEDGRVDINDVTVLIEYVLGNEVSVFNRVNADVNDDNIIDINDVTKLINYVLKGTWAD